MRIARFLDTHGTEMGQSIGLSAANASLFNDRLQTHKTNLMILGMRKKSGLLRNKFAVNQCISKLNKLLEESENKKKES